MAELDLQHIELLIGSGNERRSVFDDFMEKIGNRSLTGYKRVLQWGAKRGESLYTHVMNGICVLAALRGILRLSDDETRVLYVAFAVHDINKLADSPGIALGRVATRRNLEAEMEGLGVPDFLPQWRDYSYDIESLVRGHPAHHQVGGERWIVSRSPKYGLGLDRVNALIQLVRAADIVDLSHTLEECKFKADFLSHINAFLADSRHPVQYEFVTHRLTEQRGILTNVIHNAVAAELRERYNLLPLLYYPDGIAYLIEKGRQFVVGDEDLPTIARRVSQVIARLTATNFSDFIEPAAAGIKVDAKCLELGIPFNAILGEIYRIVQKRTPDPIDLDAKARDWAQRGFEKNKKAHPPAADAVQAALADRDLLVSADVARLRDAEIVRSYYIFLNKHFSDQVRDAWARIYELLDLPASRFAFYDYFDALYARAYVLSRDLQLSEEEIYRRIEGDGAALLASESCDGDPKVDLFAEYLRLYAVFSSNMRVPTRFEEHLAHYVENQHKQCVYCSGPFPTDKWMAGDVRSDITVQTFSNRLRGGPGEPKKYICAVCQLQFLLEKLNYTAVRGEKTIYLHLFPYSFLTGPFIEGLGATIARIVNEDTAVQTLNMRVPEAIQEYLEAGTARPSFRSRTAADRPQPYGIYVPRYAETFGNLLIFPINPAGKNDTERFLFALWNALLLQRYFGVKVLMSNLSIPPLGKDDIPDLYVDNIPLACRGLLTHNDFAQFEDGTADPATLPKLWDTVEHLFALRRLTFSSEDNTAALVRALVDSPLLIYYTTEKLLEERMRKQNQEGGLLTWLSQQAYPHVEALALQKGGHFMERLSEQLRRLAEIAWTGGLRGRTLEKSSLLYPVSEIFAKVGESGGHADREVLRAAAAQDIFDHLSRIAGEQYRPGKKKWEATKQFVDIWFDGVLDGVYGGNLRKFMGDEKLIRSAYLFYIREQVPRKQLEEVGNGPIAEDTVDTETA